MKISTLHKILNPILVVLTINLAVTAILGDELPSEAFEFLHEGGGVLFLVLIAIHFILNFNWVKANYFAK